MSTEIEIIERAENSGWVEFRVEDIQVAMYKAESDYMREMKRAVTTIEGMATARGLYFFGFRDARTRQYVFRVETREYQAQRRAELDARIARMKELRPKIGLEELP